MDKKLNVREQQIFIEHKAYELRKWSIIETTHAGSGHVTSCLSAADIVAALFFYAMRYDPHNFNHKNNDRFILSKGHAAPLLYTAWEQLGLISEQDLFSYRVFGSNLEGHPTYRFPYAEAATGSLGMGLSIGVGEALCAKLDKTSAFTYVLMGDSETSEGSVWEAAEIAAHYKLDNLVGIIDCNRLGQSCETLFGYHVKRYENICAGFGFKTYVVDGHNVHDLMAVFDEIRVAWGAEKPSMIIAKTHKGYGVDLVQDKQGFHGKAFKKEQLESILAQLKERFSDAAAYVGDKWQPQIPDNSGTAFSNKSVKSQTKIQLPVCNYAKDSMIATRKAYGQALALLGDVSLDIVSLDAEVKNSTFAELFEEKHPERFYQCYIAEQNMVGMGIGFGRRGKISFISTFGCFFTRAHDQIRMAVMSNVALRLVGSHVGVSIGEDGPSQMALEDISMMRALPCSVVLYPCDAVSTYKLVEQMARYDAGISYMRTTRPETPILYDNNTEFVIGGCKVVRHSAQDSVCIIAAGITLWEALKAHDQLIERSESVHISVIDLYSIKPFDIDTVIATARNSGNKIITVEDHYIQGGMGEMVAAALCNTDISVTSLAVTELPRSGKAEELLAWAKIDAEAIVAQVLRLLFSTDNPSV